jgi:hypothetical protein
VIDTIGKKAVLILGRFTTDRKAVLDAIGEALRKNGYLPILFDFEKPSTRDTHETIVTLAGMVRFIIADAGYQLLGRLGLRPDYRRRRSNRHRDL